MAGTLRKVALLVSACSLLAARAVFASPPDPAQSIIPSRIYLVGGLNGIADAPAGQFQVTVRDLSGVPIDNSKVEIDFSNCSVISICAAQEDAGQIVECAERRVLKYTVAGVATFTIMGSSPSYSAHSPLCARVFADDILLGSVPVALYDLGGSGQGGTAFSTWLFDYFSLSDRERSDYVAPYSFVSAADLSRFLEVQGQGRSYQHCAGLPGGTCP